MAEPHPEAILDGPDAATLQKRIYGLETLLELTRSLVMVRDRRRIDDFLLLTAMGLFSVSRAILLARDGEEDRFEVVARGLREGEIRDRLDIRLSGVFARRLRVAREPVPLREEGLPEREREAVRFLIDRRIRLAAPIRGNGKLNGILLLGDRIRQDSFSPFEKQMLRSILDLAGIVMDNAELVGELRDANLALEERNERMKELDRMKSRFLSNMGHELRTPLTAVIGFAECLRYPDVDREKQVEFIDQILRAGRKLSNLIEQVMDLSEMDHRTFKLRPGKGDLNRLVQEVTEALRPEMEEKNLDLQLDLKEALPESWFDMDRTKRVVRNLMDNAIKFSKKNGRVRVASGLEGDQVTLSIADTGDGIPPEEIALIFDRFRQVDGSETRAHGGAGIGLSLVKEIMEGQQGSVSVDSSPGSGSVFTIRLPRDGEEEGIAEPVFPAEGVGQS
ncbi:MAG: HAMP domain-containing histidine kinase [Candidatus Eisenbacteria bacterium]|nr:HAMP domain-containing histidine kinase [Candidatus Eisenbacteria bacterium]